MPGNRDRHDQIRDILFVAESDIASTAIQYAVGLTNKQARNLLEILVNAQCLQATGRPVHYLITPLGRELRERLDWIEELLNTAPGR